MTDMPYLIQRIIRQKNPDKSGVDRYFLFDYMGSAEFEFGALPKALSEMRSEVTESWAPEKIEAAGHTIWFVGPPRFLSIAAKFFEAEISGARMYLKEVTCIRDTYLGTSAPYKLSTAFVGWWCVDKGKPFILFKEKDDAGKWLECLRNKEDCR